MKTLQDYISEKQTALFNKYDVFFAFSDKQLEEGLAKVNRTRQEYYSMGMGMLCPKEHANNFLKDLDVIVTQGIKDDVGDNTIEGVIRRELYNHEAFYTGDITDTVESLKDYPCTADDVREVYQTECEATTDEPA